MHEFAQTYQCRGGIKSETCQQRLEGDLGAHVAEGRAVEVELPASVTLKVTVSPEGLRGDTASNVQKHATLETGLVVNVPLFIKGGEMVKIDTRTGSYTGRA